MREINRGINDFLNLIRTISPYVNPGQYGELKKVEDVLRKFGAAYGTVVDSPNALAQQSVDNAVAEAVTPALAACFDTTGHNVAVYFLDRERDEVAHDGHLASDEPVAHPAA